MSALAGRVAGLLEASADLVSRPAAARDLRFAALAFHDGDEKVRDRTKRRALRIRALRDTTPPDQLSLLPIADDERYVATLRKSVGEHMASDRLRRALGLLADAWHDGDQLNADAAFDLVVDTVCREIAAADDRAEFLYAEADVLRREELRLGF